MLGRGSLGCSWPNGAQVSPGRGWPLMHPGRRRRCGDPCQARGSKSLLTPFPPSLTLPRARWFAILPPRPARVISIRDREGGGSANRGVFQQLRMALWATTRAGNWPRLSPSTSTATSTGPILRPSWGVIGTGFIIQLLASTVGSISWIGRRGDTSRRYASNPSPSRSRTSASTPMRCTSSAAGTTASIRSTASPAKINAVSKSPSAMAC
jgi:hypothetical protein